MPDPRTIAKQVNDASNFGTEVDYDAEAGVPTAIAGKRGQQDYAFNPTNPPEAPAPAKNLKR